MKRLPLLLLLLLACARPSLAQRSRKPNTTAQPAQPQVTVDEALAQYDFALAEQLLQSSIAQLKRKKQPTLHEEERLHYTRLGQQKLSAVERVLVFDSVALPRRQALQALSLSSESGSVLRTADVLPALGAGPDEVLFRSQLGDRLFYAAPDSEGQSRLHMSDIYGTEVTPALPLPGLDEEEGPQNHPYMMADGATLYFAAQSSEGLGGYDIYMTRYDAEERRFLTPENVGMPFNSPANDYLLCIDEYYNLGCFVTDRGQPADSVCVYYFVPNAARRVYVEEEVGSDALRRLARLASLRETWTAQDLVRAAQLRLQECRREQQASQEGDFAFRVADNKVCRRLDDFRSPQARQQAQQWLRARQEQQQLDEQTTRLRRLYAQGSSSERQSMAPQILQCEARMATLAGEIKKMEKETRRLELGL